VRFAIRRRREGPASAALVVLSVGLAIVVFHDADRSHCRTVPEGSHRRAAGIPGETARRFRFRGVYAAQAPAGHQDSQASSAISSAKHDHPSYPAAPRKEKPSLASPSPGHCGSSRGGGAAMRPWSLPVQRSSRGTCGVVHRSSSWRRPDAASDARETESKIVADILGSAPVSRGESRGDGAETNTDKC
jgi:hypothetical protein